MARLTFLLFGLLALLRSPTPVMAADMVYGKWFTGDGTYYGYTAGGHCSMPEYLPMYNGYLPIALNSAQYKGTCGSDCASLPCGACIEVLGLNSGSGANPIRGRFKAYVHDECPSCAKDDIDLSKSGDGRWKVSWRFIPCPASNSDIQCLFQGSHQWYKKIQCTGTRTPVKHLYLNGKKGQRTIDNFFEVHGYMRPPIKVELITMDGQKITFTLTSMVGDGVVKPSGASSSGGGRGVSEGASAPPSGGRSQPRPAQPSPPRQNAKCVPNWKRCKGRNNKYGTSRCCGDYKCVWTTRINGWRCEPPKRPSGTSRPGKCVPNWRACSGRRNVFGTSKCCGQRFACRWSRQRRYPSKMCLPRLG